MTASYIRELLINYDIFLDLGMATSYELHCYMPLPARKFEGDESNHLGQLFVTPEMISKKIKMMKENKSPGVDGIPPKLLKGIIDDINIPLAIFLCHLKTELFHQNGRKQMLHHYLKRDRGVRQKIIDQ